MPCTFSDTLSLSCHVSQVERHLEWCAHSQKVAAVVITGAGAYFCAGADLDATDEPIGGILSVSKKEHRRNYRSDLVIRSLALIISTQRPAAYQIVQTLKPPSFLYPQEVPAVHRLSKASDCGSQRARNRNGCHDR